MTQPPHASDTERYEIPSGDPPHTDQVTDPNPAVEAGPAFEPGPTETVSYSPTPEHRPEWAQAVWVEPVPPLPPGASTAASSGDAPPPVPTQPVAVDRRPRGPGIGQLLGAAL